MAEATPKTGVLVSLFEHSNLAENWPSVLSFLLVTTLTVIAAAVIFDIKRQGNQPGAPAGCRRLGLPQGQSNFHDQYDAKYAKGSDGEDSSWRVKALCIYPIKSCYPVELQTGEIIPLGMKYDRQFTFAQLVSSVAKDGSWEISHQWSFITQRSTPHLTRVKTKLWVPDPSSPTYSPDAEYVKSDGCIEVSFPYMEDKLLITDKLESLGAFIRRTLLRQAEVGSDMVTFRIPFNPPPERIKEKAYPLENMKIWNECPESLNMGVEIPQDILDKLKYSLGISNQLSLFRTDPQRYREVYRCAPRKGELVDYQPVVGMQDAYPLHIMNFASVHDVASRLPKPTKLCALRFRANIYVTGPPPYAEDDWMIIRIGSERFHVSCRTARCGLPNVDPATGERDRSEPYSTMSKFRQIDPGAGKYPCLGMQMVPLSGEVGEVKVGDEVVVERVGEHEYIPQGPS